MYSFPFVSLSMFRKRWFLRKQKWELQFERKRFAESFSRYTEATGENAPSLCKHPGAL